MGSPVKGVPASSLYPRDSFASMPMSTSAGVQVTLLTLSAKATTPLVILASTPLPPGDPALEHVVWASVVESVHDCSHIGKLAFPASPGLQLLQAIVPGVGVHVAAAVFPLPKNALVPPWRSFPNP